MFKKKNSWNIFKTFSFYTFFVFVKSCLASFGHGSGEIKEIELILIFFFLNDFSFNTRGKHRNPIFGNFSIALYKEIELILRSFFS